MKTKFFSLLYSSLHCNYAFRCLYDVQTCTCCLEICVAYNTGKNYSLKNFYRDLTYVMKY